MQNTMSCIESNVNFKKEYSVSDMLKMKYSDERYVTDFKFK